MKVFKVLIEGVSPYLQHRMDDVKLEAWEKNRGHIIERDDIAHTDMVRAEYHSYFDPETKDYYIPAEQIKGSLINAGTYVKGKVGGRAKSMKLIVAAQFEVSPEQLVIPRFDAVDKRSAVNKNVKARIIVVRPRWNNWSVYFTLSVDNDSITRETIEEIINTAGSFVGIGSFRPTNNGSFGRFKLAELKAL